MSDHEFEKRVEQKMDDLRLRPSDAVWAEVERNLRREKRRRRIVLWIPLMGLLLTAGGYYIFNGKSNADKISVVKTEQAVEKAGENTAEKTAVKTVEKTSTSSVATLPATSSSTTSSSPKNNQEESISKNSTLPKKQIENKIVTAPKVEKPLRVNNRKISNDKKPLLKDKNVNEVEVKVKADSVKTFVDSTAIVHNDNTIDTSATAVVTIDSINKKPAETKAIAKAATPKKKKQQSSNSKWQWGVKANAGVANISEGSLFDVLKAVRVEDLTGSPPVFNGIPASPAPEASPIDPGAAFSVGGFVQRKISNRVSVSVGLQYSLFTMNTSVGKRVDGVLAVNYGNFNSRLTDNYYLVAGSGSQFGSGTYMQDYTNRYHFIEMPVMTSIHILGKKKMPIMLDAGVSFSHLINTNALHFDGLNRVYYENDDFFNKFQVSLNGGLNIGLLQNSKHPLFIGPNLRYFASGLIKKDVSAAGGKQQHIWSFGLNAKMLLKK